MIGMLIGSVLVAVVGFLSGWHSHRMMISRMWRIERWARHKAQGRRS